MSSKVLASPSIETHDEIMQQLMSQTRRMKLSSPENSPKLKSYQPEGTVKDQLMYILPSITMDNLSKILSSTIEQSIGNITQSLPSTNRSNLPFSTRRRTFAQMQESILPEEMPKNEVKIKMDQIQNKKDMEDYLFGILIEKKDQLILEKQQKILENHIEKVKRDNLDLKGTLSVVEKNLSKVEDKNKELTGTLEKLNKEKYNLIRDIKDEEYKWQSYKAALNKLNTEL